MNCKGKRLLLQSLSSLKGPWPNLGGALRDLDDEQVFEVCIFLFGVFVLIKSSELFVTQLLCSGTLN